MFEDTLIMALLTNFTDWSCNKIYKYSNEIFLQHFRGILTLPAVCRCYLNALFPLITVSLKNKGVAKSLSLYCIDTKYLLLKVSYK